MGTVLGQRFVNGDLLQLFKGDLLDNEEPQMKDHQGHPLPFTNSY
jgi:hypothetical protein